MALKIQGSSANYMGAKKSGNATPSPSAKPYPATTNAGMKVSKSRTPSPDNRPYGATVRNAPKLSGRTVLPPSRLK